MARSDRSSTESSKPASQRAQLDAAESASSQESVGDVEQASVQESLGDVTGHQLSDADKPAQVSESPGESTVEVLTNQAQEAELAGRGHEKPAAATAVPVRRLISFDALSSPHAAQAVVTYAEGELRRGTAGDDEYALVNAIADVAIEPGGFPCGEVPCRIAARNALTALFRARPELVRHVEERGTALLTQGVDFPLVVGFVKEPATT
jgi:hypothetical protein